MYTAQQIRTLEIELSSNCQASCPLCLRNFHGATYNKGYTVKSLTVSEIKQILPTEFVAQLDTIIFEGNLGDAIVVSDLADTVEYLRSCNPHCDIELHTNASAGSKQTWVTLAEQRVRVFFALDGLADKHHLYRRGTNWQKIIDNAGIFMSAGGDAIWKFIPLTTNQHQQEDCRRLSVELGFSSFAVMSDQRQNCHVFDAQGEYQYSIGNPKGPKDFKQAVRDYEMSGEHQDLRPVPKRIDCYADKRKYLYLDALGDVYPCCYLGSQPRTFDRTGGVQKYVHKRVDDIMHNNNLFENTIDTAIDWFNQIPPKWNAPMSDRLAACDNVCGKNTNYIEVSKNDYNDSSI